MRTSRSSTTLMTANGEVQTREEATEHVKKHNLFVTVMLLEETPAVLPLGKLCEDHGYTYHWTSGRKPQLTKQGKTIGCNISNYVPFLVPGLSTSSRIPYLTSADTPKIQYPKEVEVRVRSYGETRCINQLKPQKKKKDAKKYTAIYCMTCQTGCRSSEKNWSMKVVLQSH